MAQNFGRVKLWRIDRFMSFGKENVGEFTLANISYFSEPGIWLGKLLANGICFAKFAKVFPTKIWRYTVWCILAVKSLPIMPTLCLKLAYYASIMIDALACLLST